MTVELFDEIHVRGVLKRAIAQAGGVLLFASKHKLRPRDLDLSLGGLIAPPVKVLRSIGYVRSIRYARDDSLPPHVGQKDEGADLSATPPTA